MEAKKIKRFPVPEGAEDALRMYCFPSLASQKIRAQVDRMKDTMSDAAIKRSVDLCDWLDAMAAGELQ
jgi:hypothetical protein